MENPSKYLGNELEYVRRVLNSESWSATGGNWNNALEGLFCEKFGVKYAVAMNSGTSTLHAGLVAAGVGPGDEVISPGLTVIMDATATIHAGAKPVFSDVCLDTFNIKPDSIKDSITDRTKAIIAVSLYGLPPDMDKIVDIAKKHNLVVIEDNAQCVMSKYMGRLSGTLGDMASYSFETTKHISCGEGGMLITDNELYAETARKIGGHGFKNLKAQEGRVRLNDDEFQNPEYKRHDVIGWNYRLSEFNAAVAMAQLERVDELVDMRIQSANMLMSIMKMCDYLTPQTTPPGYTNSYYTLGVVYRGDESIGVSWKDFRKAYIENGGDGIYGAWSVPYQEPSLVHLSGHCPNAEWLQSRLMQFKTNYRDRKYAEMKSYALYKTIKDFQ